MRPVLVALAFLTRLPFVYRPATDEDLAEATRAFPLVGLVVAVATLLGLAAGSWLISPAVGAVVAVAVGMLVTGGLHVDGLSDCFDGWLCNGDGQRRLDAMHDPRVGGLAAAWVALWIVAKVALVAACVEGGTVTSALWCAPILARAPLAFELRHWRAATPGVGLFGRISVHVGRDDVGLALLSAAALVIPALYPPGPVIGQVILAVIGCAVATLVWDVAWFRKIGGLNGDVVGGAVEVREMVVLLAMATTPLG